MASRSGTLAGKTVYLVDCSFDDGRHPDRLDSSWLLRKVCEAIPELEYDQTANLAAEAARDLWTHPPGAEAEPIPELKFDQTLGL